MRIAKKEECETALAQRIRELRPVRRAPGRKPPWTACRLPARSPAGAGPLRRGPAALRPGPTPATPAAPAPPAAPAAAEEEETAAACPGIPGSRTQAGTAGCCTGRLGPQTHRRQTPRRRRSTCGRPSPCGHPAAVTVTIASALHGAANEGRPLRFGAPLARASPPPSALRPTSQRHRPGSASSPPARALRGGGGDREVMSGAVSVRARARSCRLRPRSGERGEVGGAARRRAGVARAPGVDRGAAGRPAAVVVDGAAPRAAAAAPAAAPAAGVAVGAVGGRRGGRQGEGARGVYVGGCTQEERPGAPGAEPARPGGARGGRRVLLRVPVVVPVVPVRALVRALSVRELASQLDSLDLRWRRAAATGARCVGEVRMQRGAQRRESRTRRRRRSGRQAAASGRRGSLAPRRRGRRWP